MFGCLLEEVMGNGDDMALPCVVEDIVVTLLCSDGFYPLLILFFHSKLKETNFFLFLSQPQKKLEFFV